MSQNHARHEPLPENLIEDLQALTPAQLQAAKTFLKDLRGQSKRFGNIEVFSEMLSIGIVLVDEHGDIAYANTAAEKMFGYAQGELAQRPLASLFPNELDLRTEPAQELRALSKQGRDVALKIGWSFIRLEGQSISVASISDLTASKSIEGVLRKHEQQKELIFSKGLLGDFVWNVERDDLEAHPSVFKLYGAAPIAGPVPGDWFRSRQHPEDRVPTRTEFERQLAAGADLAVEFRVNGDDGVMRWVECRAVAIRDEHGVPIEVRGLNIDITERKLAEIERRESEARALRAEALLRTALEYSNTVVWRWHIDEGKLEWWGSVKQLYGVDASALSSLAGFRQLVLPGDLAGVQETIAKNRESHKEIFHEFRIVRPDGEVR